MTSPLQGGGRRFKKSPFEKSALAEKGIESPPRPIILLKMRCNTYSKKMNYSKELKLNDYALDGWRCHCGEIYFNPEQAQRILRLNKQATILLKQLE